MDIVTDCEPLQSIALADVDAAQRTFAVSQPWQVSDVLLQSIDSFGVLCPILLRRSPQCLQIVHGFQRFEAARRCGRREMPALICRGGDDRDLFLRALEENRTSRPLSRLEKATALHKLKLDCDFSEEKLIHEWLPLLGLKPDRYSLNQQLRLAELPEPLKKAVDAFLEPEIALRLRERRAPFQDLVLRTTAQLRLGINKQRELFGMLDEICAGQDDASPDELWREVGADSILAQEGLGPSEKWTRINRLLRKRRYPLLSKHEESFALLRTELKMPPAMRLQAPRHFEDERLAISLSVRNPKELDQLAQELRRIAGSDPLRGIFELL